MYLHKKLPILILILSNFYNQRVLSANPDIIKIDSTGIYCNVLIDINVGNNYLKLINRDGLLNIDNFFIKIMQGGNLNLLKKIYYYKDSTLKTKIDINNYNSFIIKKIKFYEKIYWDDNMKKPKVNIISFSLIDTSNIGIWMENKNTVNVNDYYNNNSITWGVRNITCNKDYKLFDNYSIVDWLSSIISKKNLNGMMESFYISNKNMIGDIRISYGENMNMRFNFVQDIFYNDLDNSFYSEFKEINIYHKTDKEYIIVTE